MPLKARRQPILPTLPRHARKDNGPQKRQSQKTWATPVVSDGAEWIRSTCEEIFGGRKVTFVLDMFQCLEYAAAAVRTIHPDGAERDRRYAEIRANIMEGWAAKVVREGAGAGAVQRPVW